MAEYPVNCCAILWRKPVIIKCVAFVAGMALASAAYADTFYVPGTQRVLSAPTVSWRMELPMDITMVVIPHSKQQYDTVGDWRFLPGGNLLIKVSKMSDPRYETLVATHELVEAVLCKQAGVSEEAVTAFDVAYEKNRKDGDLSEPGDDPKAPYHDQHLAASELERLLAAWLQVDWDAYNAEVESMGK